MQKINYPLIVSDFDGTLVNNDGSIHEKNKEAIAKYVAAGGKFAISTGRLPAGILSRARELGLKGMVSCCQGSIIMDIETQEVVLEGRIPLETTIQICKKMEEMHLHFHVYDLWDFYSNMDDEALKNYEKAVKSKGKVVEDRPLSRFVAEEGLATYKVLTLVLPEDNLRVIEELAKENFPDCEVTRSGEYLVEVINGKYSKGTAIEFLANYYNVPLEKTIAVGDQWNDMPMIKSAGLGIAVNNADERLKQAANYVCQSTNKDGAIWEVIEKFGFCKED